MRASLTAPTEEVVAQPRERPWAFTVTVPYTPATYGPRQPQTLNRAARARGKGRRT